MESIMDIRKPSFGQKLHDKFMPWSILPLLILSMFIDFRISEEAIAQYNIFESHISAGKIQFILYLGIYVAFIIIGEKLIKLIFDCHWIWVGKNTEEIKDSRILSIILEHTIKNDNDELEYNHSRIIDSLRKLSFSDKEIRQIYQFYHVLGWSEFFETIQKVDANYDSK